MEYSTSSIHLLNVNHRATSIHAASDGNQDSVQVLAEKYLIAFMQLYEEYRHDAQPFAH